MAKHRQAGFTLVELMVAMVVGTIIILGAGQLFLTTFQTFQKVDELSRKQETVVFAANTLVNAYRKGEGGRYELRGEDGESNELESCTLYDNYLNQPVLDGLYKNGAGDGACNYLMQDDLQPSLNGLSVFSLRFGREDEGNSFEEVSFYVMDRASAINPGS